MSTDKTLTADEIQTLLDEATEGPWFGPHLSESDTICNCGYIFAMGDERTVCRVHDELIEGNENMTHEEAVANGKLLRAASDFARTALADKNRIIDLEKQLAFHLDLRAVEKSPEYAKETAQLEQAEHESELTALFELHQTRMTEATALWREATGKYEILLDLGDLLTWLIKRIAELAAKNKRMLELLEGIVSYHADDEEFCGNLQADIDALIEEET